MTKCADSFTFDSGVLPSAWLRADMEERLGLSLPLTLGLTLYNPRGISIEIILNFLLKSPNGNFTSIHLLTANIQFYQLLLLHKQYLETCLPFNSRKDHLFSYGIELLAHGRKTNIYITNLDCFSSSLNFCLQLGKILDWKIT